MHKSCTPLTNNIIQIIEGQPGVGSPKSSVRTTITTINMYKISQERTVSILYRTEYIALREIGIGIGRIAGYGLVILAALSQNQQMLKYLILFISIIFAIMGYMSVVLSNWINTKENAKC